MYIILLILSCEMVTFKILDSSCYFGNCTHCTLPALPLQLQQQLNAVCSREDDDDLIKEETWLWKVSKPQDRISISYRYNPWRGNLLRLLSFAGQDMDASTSRSFVLDASLLGSALECLINCQLINYVVFFIFIFLCVDVDRTYLVCCFGVACDVPGRLFEYSLMISLISMSAHLQSVNWLVRWLLYLFLRICNVIFLMKNLFYMRANLPPFVWFERINHFVRVFFLKKKFIQNSQINVLKLTKKNVLFN